jgi:hypothetical protein
VSPITPFVPAVRKESLVTGQTFCEIPRSNETDIDKALNADVEARACAGGR